MAIATVTFTTRVGVLYAYLAGEIDHDSAQQLRETIDARLMGECPRYLVLDFGQVGFMDSSGLGLILGRQRRVQALGGTLSVQHPPEQVAKMLKLVQIEVEQVEV